MANEIDDLAREMDELRRSMQGLGEGSKESSDNLKKFSKTTLDSSKVFASSIAGFSKQVAQGDTSLKTFNGVVDGAATALINIAKAIPFAGAALGALAEGAKFVVDQLDNTAAAFNELGQVGALTAKNMDGLQQQFRQSGLTFDGYRKAVVANSQVLARFGGVAGEGAEKFTKAVGLLADPASRAGDDLRRLGFNVDQIAETGAAYLRQQTLLGRSRSVTERELTSGTKTLAYEMDTLAKLTGKNRKDLQAQQEEAMREGIFLSQVRELELSGRKEEAAALRSVSSVLSSIDPSLGKGFRDLTSGIVDTPEAIALFQTSAGEMFDIIQQIKSGVLKGDSGVLAALGKIDKAVKPNVETLQGLAAIGIDATSGFNQLSPILQLLSQNFGDVKTLEEALAKIKKGQLGEENKLTNQTIEAQKNMLQLNRVMGMLGFTLMPYAAHAVKMFGDGVLDVLDKTGKVLKMDLTGGIKGMMPGAADARPGASAPTEPDTTVSLFPGEDEQLALFGKGSRSSSKSSTPATGAPAPGGAAPSPSGLTDMLGAIKPEDFITFTGGTGSRSHFDKLQPEVRDAFLQMARTYYFTQGKKLQINSSFRSMEEQAALKEKGVSHLIAAPGNSLHQQGRAIDIQSSEREWLERNGFLAQYGFKSLGDKDPMHIFMREGGVAVGPKSGYQATLHGTEAVVPLSGGRSIPVEMSGFQSTLQNQIDVMHVQISKLDELIAITKSNNSINKDMLRVARA
jgi:hypothetical protein